MNERIQELMNQTGVPVSMPFDKWCENFAELIIQECASIARQTNLEKAGRSYMVHKVIKEKFSIE
jgi:hypothetical protein